MTTVVPVQSQYTQIMRSVHLLCIYSKSSVNFWIIQTALPAVGVALCISWSFSKVTRSIGRSKHRAAPWSSQGSLRSKQCPQQWDPVPQGPYTVGRSGNSTCQQSQGSWGDEPDPSRKVQCRHRIHLGDMARNRTAGKPEYSAGDQCTCNIAQAET